MYLQHNFVGDTIVYHWASNLWYPDNKLITKYNMRPGLPRNIHVATNVSYKGFSNIASTRGQVWKCLWTNMDFNMAIIFFKTHFLETKFWHFDSNFIENCSRGFNWQYGNIGSGNGHHPNQCCSGSTWPKWESGIWNTLGAFQIRLTNIYIYIYIYIHVRIYMYTFTQLSPENISILIYMKFDHQISWAIFL